MNLAVNLLLYKQCFYEFCNTCSLVVRMLKVCLSAIYYTLFSILIVITNKVTIYTMSGCGQL